MGAVVSRDKLKRILPGQNEEDVICKICQKESSAAPPSWMPHIPYLSGINKEEPLILGNIRRDLTSYLCGERISFSSYSLHMNLSSFACKVLTETRKIPYGEVRSYKWVAQMARSKAYRAVGRILSINPFPIVVPCHRVVRADGGLGGFSSGIELKKKLLRLEGVSI